MLWFAAVALARAGSSPLPPIVASPPSTLLPPGQTTLPLTLSTAAPTTCKWDKKDVPYASMANSFGGGAATAHTTTLTGLSGALQAVTVYVRCAAYPSYPLALVYRSLPDTKVQPYPKLGNLWGSGNFRGHPVTRQAHFPLAHSIPHT